MIAAQIPDPIRIKYAARSGFAEALSHRVKLELRDSSIKGGARMYLKAGAMFAWFLASYVGLVFFTVDISLGIFLSISLGLAMAGIGFSVQHDANHGGFAVAKRTNRFFALALDVMGGSSYMWTQKHNIVHHTYPNVIGVDDDIDLGILARLAPGQRRLRIHRLQRWYIWVLYSLLAFKWHLIGDFQSLILGRVGSHRAARPRGRELAYFIGGKLVFFGYALVLPLAIHPSLTVLSFLTITSMTLGLTLAVVFQLAHCVEEAGFVTSPHGVVRVPEDFAMHQVRTTVNFAPNNRWLTWYLGGLNFQIEHHLFPKMCHLHYPRIAPIVKATCAEYGVAYQTHPSGFAALRSHWRWLVRMGAIV